METRDGPEHASLTFFVGLGQPLKNGSTYLAARPMMHNRKHWAIIALAADGRVHLLAPFQGCRTNP